MTIMNSIPRQHEALEISISQPCGYRIDNDRIYINVQAIANNRNWQNVSGTLSIELWALKQAYRGGHFEGHSLAGTSVGTISGQCFIGPCQYELSFNEPPVGHWNLCLMLREWTAQGYETRDAINFDLPYNVGWKPSVIRGGNNVVSVDFHPEEVAVELAELAHEKPSAQEETPLVKTVDTSTHTDQLAEEEARSVAKTREIKSKESKNPARKASSKIAAPPLKEKQSVAKAEQESVVKPTRKPSQKAKASMVNVNSAKLEELEAIKGLSKHVAHNIYHGRPFANAEELLKVKGLGKKLLDKVKPNIEF